MISDEVTTGGAVLIDWSTEYSRTGSGVLLCKLSSHRYIASGLDAVSCCVSPVPIRE